MTDNNEEDLQLDQNSLSHHTPVHSNQNCVGKHMFKFPVPDILIKNIPAGIFVVEKQQSMIVDRLLSSKSPDFKVDADILDLTEPGSFLGGGIDDYDMYLASGPDNATDAYMRALAINLESRDAPTLFTEPNHHNADYRWGYKIYEIKVKSTSGFWV